MKTTKTKNAIKPPVLPFQVESKDELIRIPYATGKKRAISVTTIADGLEHLLTRATQTPEEYLNARGIKCDAIPNKHRIWAQDSAESLLHIARFQVLDILTKAVARMNQVQRQHPERWLDVTETAGALPVNYNNSRMAKRNATSLIKKLG